MKLIISYAWIITQDQIEDERSRLLEDLQEARSNLGPQAALDEMRIHEALHYLTLREHQIRRFGA